jgi:hypothetical protein
MIVAPQKVDAYLQAKGISPRMSDPQWAAALETLKPFFKDQRWFQVKLLHQQEDALRRFSSHFPESVPEPYRFIDYIQFAVGGVIPENDVIAALESRGVPFTKIKEKNGPDEEDVVTLVRVGPRPPR